MKVRYSFSVRERYQGELDLSEKEFESLNKLGDEELAEELWEMVYHYGPTDFEGEYVDEFNITEEN